MMVPTLRWILLAVLGGALLGCSSGRVERFEAAAARAGLKAVESPVRHRMFVKPGVDLGAYDGVDIASPEVSHDPTHHDVSPGLTESDYRLDAQDLETFRSRFVEAVSGVWEDRPGRKAPGGTKGRRLILRTHISELHIVAPLGANPASKLDTWVTESSRMTLHAEWRDRETGELVATAYSRLTTGDRAGRSGIPHRAWAGRYWQELSIEFRRWATAVAPHLSGN